MYSKSILSRLSLFLHIFNVLGVRGPDGGMTAITNIQFYKATSQVLQQVHQAHIEQSTANITSRKPVKRQNVKRSPIKMRNTNAAQLRAARTLVAEAQASQAAYNEWNIHNPRRNNYYHKPSGAAIRARADSMKIPQFSEAVMEAVALVGDMDTQDMANNGTMPDYWNDERMRTHTGFENTTHHAMARRSMNVSTAAAAAGGGWLGQLNHVGGMPFGGDPSYKVR